MLQNALPQQEPGLALCIIVTDLQSEGFPVGVVGVTDQFLAPTGRPEGARIRLDNDAGGLGGWYIDPVPWEEPPMVPITEFARDDGEYTELINAFTATPAPSLPRRGGGTPENYDFYRTALHEIGHALGIADDPELAITSFLDDIGDDPNPMADPSARLFSFNTGGVQATFTNDGGLHFFEGPELPPGGGPIHPDELLNAGRTIMSARRQLISDLDVRVLKAAYGFVIPNTDLPSQFNTFFANLDTSTDVLTIQGRPGAGSDSITVDTLPGTTGSDYIRVQVNGTSELLRFDQVASIVINAGGGNDVIDLLTLPVGVSTTINGGGGNDTITIGAGDLGDHVRGAVSVSGGAGSDSLLVPDQDDAGNDVYTITNSSVTKPGTLFGGLSYSSDVETLVVTANEFNNTVNIVSLASTVNLTVNGRAGSDLIVVGGQPAIIGGAILGGISINGGIGGDLLVFDDSAGSAPAVYTLNGGTYQQTGTNVLTFSNTEAVELRGNDLANSITIANTSAYDLTVEGNGGDDNIDIGAGIAAVLGDTTVSGGAGADTLLMNDIAAPAATTMVVDQEGASPSISLFGGSTIITYDSIANLIVDAGPLDDSITSIRVPAETALRINGNGGSDFIDVQGHPTMPSVNFPRVTVDGGAGNDMVEINTDPDLGARVTFETSQTLARLAIGASGRLMLAEGGYVMDVIDMVSMPASGFELDLTDGFFVRRDATSFSFYEARVTIGYNGGLWDGLGIYSSTAAASALGDGIGLARASELFGGSGGTIGSISLQPTDIILRYTLYGDADLTGNVNANDFTRLSSSFGQTGTVWSQGNFNYDKFTNANDFGPLATNFGLVAAPTTASGSASHLQELRALRTSILKGTTPFAARFGDRIIQSLDQLISDPQAS